jgi:4'-phosphopantetheinyl transferase EntD
VDARLQQDLSRLARPDLRIGHRLIQPGDEDALFPEEAVSMAARSREARRAGGAGRLVARALMPELGFKPGPIRGTPAGAPDWPRGLTGSFAHDDTVAVCAIASAREFRSLGIDVEPIAPLPFEMIDLVTTPRERQGLDPLGGRVVFAAKEAVYKAVYPLNGRFLEFHDIEIDLAAQTARVRDGSVLTLRIVASSHLVVVAFP